MRWLQLFKKILTSLAAPGTPLRRPRSGWIASLALLAVALPAGAMPPPPEVPSEARAVSLDDTGSVRVEARLLVEHDEITTDVPFRAGVLLDIEPGWHIYSHEPDDDTPPSEVSWHLSESEIAPTAWPRANRYSVDVGGVESVDILGHGGRVLLTTFITPRARMDGPLDLQVEARFIACGVGCVPVELELHRTLVLGAEPVDDLEAEATAALFDAASPITASGGARVGWMRAFVLALLGGLILNGMPCVLPVLAIKTVALAELAQSHRRHVLGLGAAYAVGIQVSMLLLAGAVLALRGAGTAVGWGFQFQSPGFLIAISMLLLLFALNLLGVWEIRADVSRIAAWESQAHGLRRSFFDGFLAVALATPCSAPFLGTAVGFAFAGGPIEIVTIFAAIGLGLALPFVLVSMMPQWRRWIPASGRWMLHLRSLLGIALLATLVWLLWILGRTAGTQAQHLAFGLLALAAVGTVGLGASQRKGRKLAVRALLCGQVALFVLGISLIDSKGLVIPGSGSATQSASNGITWHAFDPQAIQNALRSRRAVFVSFTADWCVTCQVNERVVLSDPAIAEALERLDILAFRADWTRQDETIRAELARHGKAGIPVYLVYDPDRPDAPRILPEILTVDGMLEALEAATREPRAV